MNKRAIWLVALLVPIISCYLSLQILLTPAFLKWEYSHEILPEDTYGFTASERLKWGSDILYYLNGSDTKDYLENLTLKNGSRLLNQRELDHLNDVKELLNKISHLFFLLLIFLAIIAAILIFQFDATLFFKALRLGGWLIMSLLMFLGLVGILIWAVFTFTDFTPIFMKFFTYFHCLFFEGDSWWFDESDTLIRLFPLKFWQDATIWLCGLIFMFAGGITCISSFLLKRCLSLKK